MDTLDWRRKVSNASGIPLGSKNRRTVDLLPLLTNIPAWIHSRHGSYLLVWLNPAERV